MTSSGRFYNLILRLVDVKTRKRQAASAPFESSSPSIPHVDLGWKTPAASTSRKVKQKPVTDQSVSSVEVSEDNHRKTSSSQVSATSQQVIYLYAHEQQNRTQLIKELSARLKRDMQLKYATRELEMQRLLMGKGARKKLRGVEKVEGEEDEEDGESDDDSRNRIRTQEPATYRPRVYKWRVERKK
jgi:U3 small nucleolar RNA-associated protein 11